MNVPVISEKLFSLQEYIAFEEQSDVRHEFINGQIVAMAGGTFNHNRIKRHLARIFENVFEPQGCSVFDDGVKLEIIENQRYTYPDVFVTCEEFEPKEEYIVKAPNIVIEVLSNSTAEYDRGDKFKLYQKVTSIRYYILVDSRQVSVELFARTDNKSLWTYQIFSELTDIIEIPALEISIPLRSIYENINFGNE